MPAAICACRSTYFASRNCIWSSCFCVLAIFEILALYQSFQLNSTHIESSWEAAQFLPNSLLSSPVTEMAIILFTISPSNTELYSVTNMPLRRRITSRYSGSNYCFRNSEVSCALSLYKIFTSRSSQLHNIPYIIAPLLLIGTVLRLLGFHSTFFQKEMRTFYSPEHDFLTVGLE